MHDFPASAEPIATRRSAPLPDARRLVIVSIVAMVLLAATVVGAVLYAVQMIDRLAVAGEVERAGIAVGVVGHGPEAAARLANEYVLDGARFTAPDGLGGREVSVPVPGDDDLVLAWTPRRIGSDIFYHLAPLRLAACAMFLAGIAVVVRRFYGMARELERRRREAADMAARDTLTGLGNRLAFDNWLAQADQASAETVGLLYLDLDDFKRTNDTHGHGAGDALLKIVAGRLSRLAGPGDLVARIGGDEFAFVRPGPVRRSELAELAADIGAALAEPVQLGATELAVAGSLGIAVGRPGDAGLLDAADAALYRAKALPGHAFVFADAA